MKAYIQFLTRDTEGNLCDLCGSEGVHVLDARRSWFGWQNDASTVAWRFRDIHNIVGYKIIRGTRFGEGKVVHEGMLESQENFWKLKIKLKKENLALENQRKAATDLKNMYNEPFNEDWHYIVSQNDVVFIELDEDMKNYHVLLRDNIVRIFRGTKTITFANNRILIK